MDLPSLEKIVFTSGGGAGARRAEIVIVIGTRASQASKEFAKE
jgi:hypothetical protein